MDLLREFNSAIRGSIEEIKGEIEGISWPIIGSKVFCRFKFRNETLEIDATKEIAKTGYLEGSDPDCDKSLAFKLLISQNNEV